MLNNPNRVEHTWGVALFFCVEECVRLLLSLGPNRIFVHAVGVSVGTEKLTICFETVNNFVKYDIEYHGIPSGFLFCVDFKHGCVDSIPGELLPEKSIMNDHYFQSLKQLPAKTKYKQECVQCVF